MGHEKLWTKLLVEDFGIDIHPGILETFVQEDEELAYQRVYKKITAVKLRCIQKYIKSMKAEVAKQIRDKERGATYHGKGGALDEERNGSRRSNKSKNSNSIDLNKKCKTCHGYGHVQARSKLCDKKKR